jgi:hypothetical protein
MQRGSRDLSAPPAPWLGRDLAGSARSSLCMTGRNRPTAVGQRRCPNCPGAVIRQLLFRWESQAKWNCGAHRSRAGVAPRRAGTGPRRHPGGRHRVAGNSAGAWAPPTPTAAPAGAGRVQVGEGMHVVSKAVFSPSTCAFRSFGARLSVRPSAGAVAAGHRQSYRRDGHWPRLTVVSRNPDCVNPWQTVIPSLA